MRRSGAIILFFSLLLSMCACTCSKTNVNKYSQTEFIFGTVVTLTIYAEDDSSLKGAFELCEKYENMLSSTIEGSDVWRINHAGGESVAVSRETAQLITLSLEYSHLTDGAFDITIAPLSSLWNFSSDSPSVPSQEAIDSLLPLVDYTVVSVSDCTVTIPDGFSIELGAIAKGYISDRLCDYFADCQVSAALINLGGNVAAYGQKPDGSKWHIGIRDPSGEYSDYVGTLYLDETTVVTSGVYERCFESGGSMYHHLLSSDTGYPADNDLLSVTVVCRNGAEADALSTSLYLMGADAALEYAENRSDIEAVFILRSGEILSTSGVTLN